MAINIRRINRDLSSPDVDIRMLALNTVLRLSKDNVEETDHMHELRVFLIDLGNAEDVEESFLARKGANHLTELMVGMKIMERPPAPDSVPDKSPAEIAKALGTADDPPEIAQLLGTAARHHQPELTNHVARFLQHQDARVRANAVEAVFANARPEIATALLVPHVQDPHNRVRANVARALLEIGETRVLTTLRQMLLSQSVAMRESAVFALGSLKGRHYAELLVPALRDPFAGIRVRAIRGLVLHGYPEAATNLSLILNDQDIEVAQEADTAIRILRGEATRPDGQPIDLKAVVAEDDQDQIVRDQQKSLTAQLSEGRSQAKKELEQIEAILAKGKGVRPIDLHGKSTGEIEFILEGELVSLGREAIQCGRSGEIVDPGASRHYYDVLKFHDLLEKRRAKIEEEASASGIFRIMKARLTGSEDDDPLRSLEIRLNQSLSSLGRETLKLVKAGSIQKPEVVAVAQRVDILSKKRDSMTGAG